MKARLEIVREIHHRCTKGTIRDHDCITWVRDFAKSMLYLCDSHCVILTVQFPLCHSHCVILTVLCIHCAKSVTHTTIIGFASLRFCRFQKSRFSNRSFNGIKHWPVNQFALAPLVGTKELIFVDGNSTFHCGRTWQNLRLEEPKRDCNTYCQ